VICQDCGVEAPTKKVVFHRNIGALVMRFGNSVNGELCKNCINKYFWQYTGVTAVLGWWGVISFFYTLFILPNNVIYYLGSLKLPPVPPGATPPQLTDAAVQLLRPHTDEIFSRLNANEPLDRVAADVSARTGVTPGQVIQYVVAVAEAAKQQG